MDCLGFRFCLCALFGAWLCVCESVELDSESTLDSVDSFGLRFCPCPFFRISLDSVRVFESVGLDSVFPKFSALDSESTLDSVDSKFLRVVFSRIFPRFSKSLCFFAKRGVIPSTLAKAPKKPPLFLLRLACKPLARQSRGEPRFSASSAIVAEALLPPCSNDCAPRSGRGAVGASAPTYRFDFCSAKMAESKALESLDSAEFLRFSNAF